MTSSGHDRRHPSTGTLAAHLDRRLSATESREVREHIIGCEECREIVTEAAIALGEPESVEPFMVSRSRYRWVAAAIAAAILLPLLAVTITLSRRGDRSTDLVRIAELAPDRRVIATRLSIGEWAPLAITRGDEESRDMAELLQTAADLDSQSSTEPTAASLHALGIVQMMLGDSELAEKTLADARRIGGDNPKLLVDYSAALIQTGMTRGDRERLEQAIEIIRNDLPEQKPPAASFNLALALEASGQRTAAIGAWEQYLTVDSTSEWAMEAKEHLGRLEGR